MGVVRNRHITVKIKSKQLSECAELDPVLQADELLALYYGDMLVGHKIGDGVSKLSELEYVQSLSSIDKFCCYDEKSDYICTVMLSPNQFAE